jgi:hypothetical protein
LPQNPQKKLFDVKATDNACFLPPETKTLLLNRKRLDSPARQANAMSSKNSRQTRNLFCLPLWRLESRGGIGTKEKKYKGGFPAIVQKNGQRLAVYDQAIDHTGVLAGGNIPGTGAIIF